MATLPSYQSFNSRISKALRSALVAIVIGLIFILAQNPMARGQSNVGLPDSADSKNQDAAVAMDQIESLIEKLGDDSYSERERAARQIREIGVPAYSFLASRRNSEDLEIRQRVRQLVTELLPKMLHRDVPAVEATLVGDYLSLDELTRQARISLIAQSLVPEFGSVILLRVAQLETDQSIAKSAAAGLLVGGYPSQAKTHEFLSKHIQLADDHNEEGPVGLKWLREYRRSLDDPAGSVEKFKQFADDEKALGLRSPTATDEYTIVAPLQMYALDLMIAAGDEGATDYAVEVFNDFRPESMGRELFVATLFRRITFENSLSEPTTAATVDEANAKFGFDDLLLALATKENEWFETHRIFQYLRASAAKSSGNSELAAKLFESAFDAAEDEDSDRILVAQQLRAVGISDWCEREFLAVFQREGKESEPLSMEACYRLADVLHQQGRDAEGAELLQSLFERCEEDEKAMEKLDNVASISRLQTNLHFYAAMAARERGDEESQIDEFRLCFAESRENSDAFCEAYKIENEAWREELAELVNETTSELEISIQKLELGLAAAQGDAVRIASYRSRISEQANELSWILVNTGGNLNEALRLAQLAVEYEPGESHSIDTLATCYYKLKQYDRAVEYERMAVRLAPYREDIQATLERFQAAVANQ